MTGATGLPRLRTRGHGEVDSSGLQALLDESRRLIVRSRQLQEDARRLSERLSRLNEKCVRRAGA